MKIKYLLVILTMCSTGMADNFVRAETISSSANRTSTPEFVSSTAAPAKEEMKCYPLSTVKRWAKRKKKPAPVPVVIEKTVTVVETVVKEVEVPPLKNRIRLLAGGAPTGTMLSIFPKTASLSSTTGFAMGIGYDRLLSRRWSIGVEILTNGSTLGNVGFGF